MKNPNRPILGLLLLLAISTSACVGRRHRDRIYKGSDGRLYTRTHSHVDSQFYWYVYEDNAFRGSSGNTSSAWTRISAPPTNLIPTSKVAIEENEDLTDETLESSEFDIDATTTEATVDAADASADAGDSGGSDGGSDGGGGGCD